MFRVPGFIYGPWSVREKNTSGHRTRPFLSRCFAVRWLDTVFQGQYLPSLSIKFGKIATTVVLDKDKNLLWSGLQWHRSYHTKEMVLLAILHAVVFLGNGNCSSKIVQRSFFLQWLRCSWSFREICKSVIEIFWDKVFIVRNTIKIGQSWCLVIICKKRSAFDMQFHLVVVSIFLKTCVKDPGNSSSRLLERRV